MPTPAISARLILEKLNDTGEEAADQFDETLTLSDYDGFVKKRIKLANAGDDVALAIGDSAAVVIFSHDYPFSIRLASAETLVANVRMFAVFADDLDAATLASGNLLLTGNTENDSNLEVWTIDAD